MTKVVDPYVWRLDEDFNKENVVWYSKFRDYGWYSQCNAFIDRCVYKFIPQNLGLKGQWISPKEVKRYLKLADLDSIKKGKVLATIRSAIKRRLGVEASVNVKLLDKSSLSPELIALEVEQAVVKRRNPLRVIKHYLNLVRENSIQGLKIQLKGRFWASVKTQKIIFKKGRVNVQSIAADVRYYNRLIVGKFGTSCVRVWMISR